MGILDSIQDGINKGVDGAGRATKKLQLNAQINEINRQRDQLLAQLGASLFLETRENPQFRTPREQVYADIEALDVKRANVQNELLQLEQQGQAVAAAKTTIICPNCGKSLAANSAFCTGCGTALSSIRESLALCAVCGAPLAPDVRFCTSCGTPIAGNPGLSAAGGGVSSTGGAAGASIGASDATGVPDVPGVGADGTTSAPDVPGAFGVGAGGTHPSA
ncbi:MAG: zinc ribbon domain-containing protein [Coriobacteriales bacterium]|jgi:hypothetical protein|nr:zinc ribbon domain-containing protein [Coriobacteriales bacterium]